MIGVNAVRSARQAVYEQLRAKILGAELLPGASLPENLMASVLEVSRTPLREALQRLQSDNLVQVIPQVGTFVARIELSRVREALFMREAVECAAIARLPATLDLSIREALENAVSKHRDAVERDYLNATMQNDATFHCLLLEASGMPGVWRYVHEAREMHRRVRVLSRKQTSHASVRASAAQHREILDALIAHDLEHAQDILRMHIRMNLQLAEDVAQVYPDYFVE
nr:GntR family transcriptional regulator [Caballeronia sp. GAFFF3]